MPAPAFGLFDLLVTQFGAKRQQTLLARLGTEEDDRNRQCRDQADHAEYDIGGTPSVIGDDGAGDRGKDHATEAGAAQGRGYGQTTLEVEPVGHHDGDEQTYAGSDQRAGDRRKRVDLPCGGDGGISEQQQRGEDH